MFIYYVIQNTQRCFFDGSIMNTLAKNSYFCPNPENFRSLFLPCFSKLIFTILRCWLCIFWNLVETYLKTPHSAHILGKLDLKVKCAKMCKSDQKNRCVPNLGKFYFQICRVPNSWKVWKNMPIFNHFWNSLEKSGI